MDVEDNLRCVLLVKESRNVMLTYISVASYLFTISSTKNSTDLTLRDSSLLDLPSSRISSERPRDSISVL
jgi:hypothetical protein